MTLPATVDASLSWPDWKNTHCGPFEVGGSKYIVGVDKTQNKIKVLKSTDGGHTWSEQDAANKPFTGTASNFKSATARLDGTSIVVFHCGVSSTTPQITKFATATDTWGASSATGAQTVQDVTGKAPLAIACRGANDYVVAYNSATESIMGTAYRRISVRPYVSGAWGTAIVVESGVQQNQDLIGLVVGSNGRTHIFWRNQTGNTLRHRPFLSGNTLGTAGDIDASINAVSNIYAGGISVSYVDGANTKVVVPYVDAGAELNVGRFTSADAPSFTTQVVTAVTDNKPSASSCNPGVAVANGTIVYVLWADGPFGDIWYDNDAGTGTWGTDVEHNATTNVDGINAEKITDAIGILYDDNGVIKYDEYSLGPPPPPFVPSPIRKVHMQAVRRASNW
jgi:hypothetical protein